MYISQVGSVGAIPPWLPLSKSGTNQGSHRGLPIQKAPLVH